VFLLGILDVGSKRESAVNQVRACGIHEYRQKVNAGMGLAEDVKTCGLKAFFPVLARHNNGG
jgi:hypothetical protein